MIGRFARELRFQGGGSSQMVPTRIENAWEALSERLGSTHELSYAPGTNESHG